jgi:hypothetical protein
LLGETVLDCKVFSESVILRQHYTSERWVDFVRGVSSEPDKIELSQHLASGCRRCQTQVDWLRKVSDSTAADAAYQVPEHLLRSARALFSLNRPAALPKLSVVVARLVFDSFRTPSLAGVRSQRLVTRQAMFEAGDYCLDLRMEREPGATQAALVGQIANRAHPEDKMARLPIVLVSGETVAKTLSNEFGEFQISYQPRTPLKLFVPLKHEGQEIEVRLNQLHE